LPSPFGWISAKQSPPMPVDCGSITPSSAQAATAASAAVPPARITSMATSAASGCDVATIAFWAWTVERPAKWKFLIASAFFSAFLGVPRGASGGFHRRFFGIFIPGWAMAGMPGERQRQWAEYAGLYGVSPARPA
jgi:hypothetical protein